MFSILVAEDDNAARFLMQTVLEKEGYIVKSARDGIEALDILETNHIDLAVLDIMMPKMDGYELTNLIRESGSDMPIIMVTAKQTLQDKKKGFISGADDYMVKPVEEEELLLRISALLRRAKITSEKKIIIGSTVLDYNSFTCSTPDGIMELPQKEFLLIFKLLSNNNTIFTRRQLMDEIWSMESETDERTVDVHINRLRERFRDNGDFDIVTVRGLGYKAVAKH